MNYRILLLLSFFLLQLSTGLSQSISVSGQLRLPDSSLPTGNVSVLSLPDSSFLQGEFILDGYYELNNLPPGDYLLQFTSLEFTPFLHPLTLTSETNKWDLGTLSVVPASLTLDQVIVRGQRQLYTQRADGAVKINVAETLLAASTSTQEILQRSPDITVDENGLISVLGKGAAIFYVNGQRIEAEQLSLIAPSNIQYITIIRNPSARYDASGGAVIEITTIANNSDGYRLNLQQNADHSEFGGQQTYSALNLGVNRGKFAFSANTSLQAGQNRHIKFTTRDRADPAIFLSSAVNTDWQTEMQPFIYYGGGVHYNFKSTEYLSLAYSGSRENVGGNTFNTNRIIDNQETLDYASTISMNEVRTNHSLSLNYGRELDSLGSRIFVGGQYNHFKTDTDNPIQEIGQLASGTTQRRLQNLLDLDIHVLALQVDYTKALAPQQHLDLGVRIGQVANDADLDFLIAELNQEFTTSSALSSHYIYNETVSAAYLNYRKILNERLTASAGLRAEWTQYDLQLDEGGATILGNYLNLFPNLSLNFSGDESRSLSMSYTARINRPPYRSLNPNLIYQDPYTSIQGNPELVPEKAHAIEFIAKRQATTIKLGYTYTIDPLSGSALPGDDPRSYVLKRLNFTDDHSFYAALTQQISLPWWTSNNTLSLNYSQARADEFAFSALAPRPQPYIISDNRFRLGPHGFFEVMAYYVGELRDGTFNRYDYGNLTLTYEKSLFQDALQVRLQAADVFTQVRASGEYGQGATAIYFDNRWRTHFYRLALTYNLNRLERSTYRNQTTGAEELNRM